MRLTLNLAKQAIEIFYINFNWKFDQRLPTKIKML